MAESLTAYGQYQMGPAEMQPPDRPTAYLVKFAIFEEAFEGELRCPGSSMPPITTKAKP
jgi:hypothetical protein